ncbi:hypothetical protein E2C01_051459 [Portunus trituberculatus]|uniref:Uncharacterized protein n=1 Tax=Portunus trituberculatus TaxID=210409 RepID=A0A5B7GIZ0_PORTR|nr:hypothetical protein [Portunus trituberculatus]
MSPERFIHAGVIVILSHLISRFTFPEHLPRCLRSRCLTENPHPVVILRHLRAPRLAKAHSSPRQLPGSRGPECWVPLVPLPASSLVCEGHRGINMHLAFI